MSEIKILLVEDNLDDLDMALHALGKANVIEHLQVARDGAEALNFIFARGPLPVAISGSNPRSFCST